MEPSPSTQLLATATSGSEWKEQRETNTAVCAKAMEECEALLSMQETSLSYIQNKIPHYKDRFESSLDAVREVEDRYRWCAPCGWTVDRLIEHYKMELSGDYIRDRLSRGVPDSSDVRLILQELSTTQVSRGRLVNHRDALKNVDKFAPLPVADVTIGLFEYLHADVLAHAKNELSQTDVTKKRLLKVIEDHSRQRDEALARGAVPELEEAHRGIIDSYGELLAILTDRLDHLIISGEDTENFNGQVDSVQRDGKEAYNAFDAALKERQDKLLSDLKNTEEVRVKEHDTHIEAVSKYNGSTTELLKQLKDNAANQDQVLATVQKLLVKLNSLGEERKGVVERYVANKQTEENRIANYNEFVATQAEHHALLLRLQDQAEACRGVCDELLDYEKRMRNALQDRQVEGELNNLSLEEGHEYLRHYRRAVFAIGEYTDKKQHRIDALQRQARQTQLHRETAINSLDPNSEVYSKQLEEMAGHLDGCQSTVAHMQSLQELHANNFKKAEGLLRTEGVSFVHPLIELSESSAENRKRMIERALRYVEDEERQVGVSKDTVLRLQKLTDAEKEESLKRLLSSSPQQQPPSDIALIAAASGPNS